MWSLHEWGHAYTEFTSGLIYQCQSGALNESYSDVWGERVDKVNGAGTDTPGGPPDRRPVLVVREQLADRDRQSARAGNVRGGAGRSSGRPSPRPE